MYELAWFAGFAGPTFIGDGVISSVTYSTELLVKSSVKMSSWTFICLWEPFIVCCLVLSRNACAHLEAVKASFCRNTMSTFWLLSCLFDSCLIILHRLLVLLLNLHLSTKLLHWECSYVGVRHLAKKRLRQSGKVACYRKIAMINNQLRVYPIAERWRCWTKRATITQ